MVFPSFPELHRYGVESWVYPYLRAAIVDRAPGAAAVLPDCYDAATPAQRVAIDRAVAAMVRELCTGEG